MAEKELKESKLLHLKKLQELGINAFPYSFKKTHSAKQLHEEFDSKIKENEFTKHKTTIAGRILGKREFGKLNFLDIVDETGKIQASIRKGDVSEKEMQLFKLLDRGDFVGIQGTLFKTQKNELTVLASSLEILGKSISVLPEKWHGLQDIETRYRHRHLDLIINPEVKETFLKRAKIIDSIREFMKARGFLEVETPILQDVASGAQARPFITHHNELDVDLFLRIALELHLKRLIIGGYEKVFEIGRNFRNEGFSKKHNPEFTMMESYEAYSDYNDVMKMTEELFEFTAKKVLGTTKIEYQGASINLKTPFKRLTMIDSLKEFVNVDFNKIKIAKEAIEAARKHKVEVNESMTKGEIMFAMFDALVEEKLIQPTFILDYPIEICPLTKTKRGNPELTERFELFIAGMEFANAYSELTNPIEQKERFNFQAKQKTAGSTEVMETDDDFVQAMEYGMPPTGGLGVGIDRMIMLLTNSHTIKDIIFFPQMRPEKNEKK